MFQFQEIIDDSPVEHGYQDHVWSVPLIVYDAATKLNLSVSKDTVIRALNSMGYSYKRPSKTVPARAPTKEEKVKKIQAMIEEIKAMLSKGETEIYALDESHFSTEPYLVRGWFKKKNGRHKIETSSKRESLTFFGCLNLVTQKFYWKKSKPSDSKAFLSLVYGFSALGGISQLVSRFRKHVWHYNKKTLPNTISFNFNAYAKIL